MGESKKWMRGLVSIQRLYDCHFKNICVEEKQVKYYMVEYTVNCTFPKLNATR